MGQLIAYVVVANANETASLAAESMFKHEPSAASIALVWEVGGSPAVPDGNVVHPFVPGELSAGESVRDS